MNSVKWINLTAGTLVTLALLDVAWTVTHEQSTGFASLAFAASLFVLMFAAIAVWANRIAIVDWFRVRVPPVVHDEIVGDLTYSSGLWRGEKLLWLEGRRMGPDPELVRAGSQAVREAAALEARARAFLVESGIAPERVGALQGIRPIRDDDILILLEFALTDSVDVLDMTFSGGEPVEFDVH